MAVGNYTVNLTANVDSNHTVSYNQSAITVNPAPSCVSGENLTVFVDDQIVVPVTSENATSVIYQIIDENGNVILNGTINPGENISVSSLPAGNYTVNLTTVVDGNHTPATNTSYIVVNKLPSPVIPTAKDIYVGEEEIVTISVAPDDATGTVNVTIAGKTYYNLPVENGTIVISILDLKAGNYTVDVTYSGDDKYFPSSNSTTFEVKKILPPVDGFAPTITIGDDGIITVTVPDDATGNITIEIEGKIYTAPVKDGKAVFNVSGLTTGLHDIKIYYSGDDKYLPNNATSIIDVLPVHDDNVTPGENINPQVTALSSNATGNPLWILLMVLALLGIGIKRKK